jgi:hypothetical protein
MDTVNNERNFGWFWCTMQKRTNDWLLRTVCQLPLSIRDWLVFTGTDVVAISTQGEQNVLYYLQ